jgi:kynureninase
MMVSGPGSSEGRVARDEAWALAQDQSDPLAWCRGEFEQPAAGGTGPLTYLCGNSLGLMPTGVRSDVSAELDDWARLGVEGHHDARTPWYNYHEQFRAPLARLVGANPGEVVAMNSLTVNLHLMLTSFYRPSGARWKVLMEESAFPSDAYAVATHLEARGLDPGSGIIVVKARAGEATIRTEDVEAILEGRGSEIALVVFPGVQYFTGQVFDCERITRAAHRAGCLVGFDLAHAAGNVVLRLNQWQVDFAVWCSYKYLNAGPGAVAGCFVHERHGQDASLPRLGGWWGNDPSTRFDMHLVPRFIPAEGADGWQLSNPPILSMAPLRASLSLFDRAGMPALRAKSERLTEFLESLVSAIPSGRIASITPADPAARGCQLSLRIQRGGRELSQALRSRGFVADYRAPDVIRAAPTPLYNSFHEVWRFGEALKDLVRPG